MGFSVTIVAPKKIDSEVASSTAIRQALADGNMEKVTRLLGRPFSPTWESYSRRAPWLRHWLSHC